MAARVELVAGSRWSERAARLDALLLKHGAAARLLVPTKALVRRRRDALAAAAGPGLWGEPVLTFQKFVEGLLRTSGTPFAALTPTAQRILLEQCAAGLDTGLWEGARAPEGFIRHGGRVIARLKEAGVDPGVFIDRIKKRQHASALDAPVADLYMAYQDRLHDQRAYDREGLYWEARLLCGQGRPPGLAPLRVLLFDQFDDFTVAQVRLIEALADHLDQIVIGLAYEPDRPSARDLYHTVYRTEDRLRRGLGARLEQEREPGPEPSQSIYASRELFWRDRPTLPAGLRENLRVVPCVRRLQELEWVARQVKALLVRQGVSPAAIAVVYPSLDDCAHLVRRVFEEFGVPVRVSAWPPVGASALARYLLRVFDALDTWGRDEVAHLLASPWFAAPDGTEAAYALLARAAQILAGRSEWRSNLRQLERRMATGPSRGPAAAASRLPQGAGAIRALQDRLGRFEQVADTFADSMTAAQFLDALEPVVREATGAIGRLPEAEQEAERHAAAALRRLVDDMRRGYGPGVDTRPLREWVAQFERALNEATYLQPEPEHGVMCLSAAEARHLAFGHVFFCGVEEGRMPAPEPAEAVYDELDYQDLGLSGAVGSHGDHVGLEMLCFHHVIAAARESLTITYCRLTPDGKEQLPSPFLAELIELFDGRVEQPAPGVLDFVPAPGFIASPRDLRNAALSRVPALEKAYPDWVCEAALGAAIENRRAGSEPFDNYDGVLAAEDVRAQMAARFGSEYQFSVTQLETYAECPFRFYVETVLGIRDDEPVSEELDPRDRGAILHDVLQRFHERHPGQSLADIRGEGDDGALVAALADIVDAVFDERRESLAPTPGGVLEVERARMTDVMARYVRIELDPFERAKRAKKGEPDWKPSHFEVSFGRAGGAIGADPWNRPEPVTLDTGAGPILFTGKIDRVDLYKRLARIVDYKSSVYVTKADFDEGRSLQLAVYAMALETTIAPEFACAEALFVAVGQKKQAEGLARGDDGWTRRRDIALQALARYVEGIRAGYFPPLPANDGLPFDERRRAARYTPSRIERKRGTP